MDIKKIVEYFEEIAGEWNGDEDGYLEDRASIANEILDKIEELNDIK